MRLASQLVSEVFWLPFLGKPESFRLVHTARRDCRRSQHDSEQRHPERRVRDTLVGCWILMLNAYSPVQGGKRAGLAIRVDLSHRRR